MPHTDNQLTPVPDNPKTAAIVDRLLTAIAAGDFLPGTRLPSERQLAETLAVGRSTVRNALSVLIDRGCIETRRGRTGGAFVMDVSSIAAGGAVERVFGSDLAQLDETIDAIALGYALAAQTAAMRRTESDLTAISGALDEFRLAVDRNDPRGAQAADGKFHHAIIDAAHQPMLHEIIQSLDRRISLSAPLHIWGSAAQQGPMHQRALDDHETILGGIQRQDRAMAFDVSYEHAKIDRDLILGLLGRDQ
ncbi:MULTISPECIES: FadR/GntR family transcriptional regulator [Brevibacterium]|uniref:GntR family transcriptional regulator n=2 Tax=Brevibacterium TaxID=1696 RepID=A0ABP9U239_9MICO